MNIDKYKNKLFFAPDEGGGEGGGGEGEVSRGTAAFEPVTKTTTGERPLPEKKPVVEPSSSGSERAGTGEPSDGAPAPTPAPAATPFDAETFAKTLSSTLGESLKPVIEGAQPKAKMTPEEAKKFLNVWEPDDAWYAKYDNLETRAAAVAEMRDGLITQADTLNQLRMQEMFEQFKQEIMPGLQTVTQTANQQREERLFGTYPLLSKPELRPVLDAVANDFIAQKRSFKTEGELFKAIANGVEAIFKVNNPEFKLEAASTGGGQQTTSTDRGGRQLPVTTPGGGGNTGRRDNSQQPTKPRGLSIFDK